VVNDFAQYIQKFPDGIFIIPANYYKAECDTKLGDIDPAITAYTFVVSKTKNEFTEQSLYRLTDMLYKKQDYKQAATYYAQLEQQAEDSKNSATAKIGLMRCSYQLKNYSTAIEYANKVIAIDKASNELIAEAHFTIAQCQVATEKLDDALAEFQAVVNSSKSEIAAESYYNIANILFLKKNYKGSQETVFDFLNGDGDYPYWVTKAMILLADDYVAMNDNFQAKATLKGIIGESNIPELIKIAQEKLNNIIAAEEAAKQVKQPTEPVKIEFEGNTPEQNKLFTEPVVPPIKEGEPKHE
jgi:TolA-binding protein